MQRAILLNRIYLKETGFKKDVSTVDGFVDGAVFVCPDLKISIPLSNVSHIEHLGKVDVVPLKADPIQNLKPAVKSLKVPPKDD